MFTSNALTVGINFNIQILFKIILTRKFGTYKLYAIHIIFLYLIIIHSSVICYSEYVYDRREGQGIPTSPNPVSLHR